MFVSPLAAPTLHARTHTNVQLYTHKTHTFKERFCQVEGTEIILFAHFVPLGVLFQPWAAPRSTAATVAAAAATTAATVRSTAGQRGWGDGLSPVGTHQTHPFRGRPPPPQTRGWPRRSHQMQRAAPTHPHRHKHPHTPPTHKHTPTPTHPTVPPLYRTCKVREKCG